MRHVLRRVQDHGRRLIVQGQRTTRELRPAGAPPWFHLAFSDAMSMQNRYFTSDFSRRSYALLTL